jgi:hypothetical protein
MVAEAVIRATLAAIVGRDRFLRGEPSEPPANFVQGGIDARALRPTVHLPRPSAARSKGGKKFANAAAEFIAERQRDPNAALREQTRGQYETTFRLFTDYCHNAPLGDINRETATGFIEALAQLDPGWGRHADTKKLSLSELLERYGKGDRQLSNKTLKRHISPLHKLFRWLRKQQKFSGDNPFSDQWKERPSKKKSGWRPYVFEPSILMSRLTSCSVQSEGMPAANSRRSL